MTKTEIRIVQAAVKHGYSHTWQPLKFGYQRAVIPCDSWAELQAVESTFRRMHGVSVNHWMTFDGVFEGYVYVMDVDMETILNKILAEERARLEDWWMRYHLADAETRALMACGAIS